ncbi:MAG TPA: hypothetical protein VLA09_13310 [Longimicrobiales bacterium]|nr:hypothetical protein [Longimicrobiales bacterium]
MRSAALAVGVAALLVPSWLEGQSVEQALEGAWRVAEVTRTGPGAGTVTSPQPGLLLFTGRHYSYTFVTSEQSRPIPPRGMATPPDLLDAWGPFTANAGTFEVSGGAMRRYPVVAKSPDAMGPDVFNEYAFRLVADTLWTTSVGTEGGPTRNPTTVKYVRVQ